MGQALRYEAGSVERQQFGVQMSFSRAGLEPHRADTLVRFIEFWCQRNCRGSWRVEETDREMIVSFAETRDRVLFQISEEFLYFEGKYDNLPVVAQVG